MSRKVRISEEQYRMALEENIELKADVAAANGDVVKAVETTKKKARESGVDLSKATISMNANESKIMTIKEWRNAKKNDNLFSKEAFLKMLHS